MGPTTERATAGKTEGETTIATRTEIGIGTETETTAVEIDEIETETVPAEGRMIEEGAEVAKESEGGREGLAGTPHHQEWTLTPLP